MSGDEGDVLAAEEEVDILQQAINNSRSSLGPRKKSSSRPTLPSMQRSQFGKQTDSGKWTAPAYGFGTAVRFDPSKPALKLYISKEHAKQEVPAYTPGPGNYTHASSLNRQELSTQRTGAKFGFGTAVRFAEELRTQKYLQQLPEPGRYNRMAACGTQVDSTKETNTVVGFGTALRGTKVSLDKGFEEDFHGMESPGPAVYNPVAGTGEQPSASKSTAPHYVFGTNPRAIDPQIPNDIERRSAAVPCPGKYTYKGSVGNQQDSTKPTKAMYGFGTCSRDRAAKTSLDKNQAPSQLAGYTGPGPASLGFGPSAYGEQPQSAKNSKPEWTFGGESRFMPNRSTSELSPGPGSYVV